MHAIFKFIILSMILVGSIIPATADTVDVSVIDSSKSAYSVETVANIMPVADNPSENTEAEQKFNDMVKQVLFIINNYVVRGIIIVATVVFLIMGVLNGIKFSKSTEEEARQKAKKNLIGWAIGVAFTFAMIWLLPMFFEFLIDLMPGSGLTDIT